MPRHAVPFALTDVELQDIEAFAIKNQLDNVALLCAELRCLRAEHIALSARVARQRVMIETMERDPSRRYGMEVDAITGGMNAPPVT